MPHFIPFALAFFAPFSMQRFALRVVVLLHLLVVRSRGVSSSDEESSSSSSLSSWLPFCNDAAKAADRAPFAPITSLDLKSGLRVRTPVRRIDDRGGGWRSRVKEMRSEARRKNRKNGRVKLMLFGDSITEYWRLPFNEAQLMASLREHAGKLGVEDRNDDVFVNGVSGDETKHALFRLETGGFPVSMVDDVVVLIGTNNLGRSFRKVAVNKRGTSEFPTCVDADTVEAIREEAPKTIAGILTLVEKMRLMSPNSRILVLGILPRGLRNRGAWNGIPMSMVDQPTAFRLPSDKFMGSHAFLGQYAQPGLFGRAIDFINDAVERGIRDENVGGNNVYFSAKCSDLFLKEHGSLGKMIKWDIMTDGLHPDKPEGYRPFGDCVAKLLANLPNNWEFQGVTSRNEDKRSVEGKDPDLKSNTY